MPQREVGDVCYNSLLACGTERRWTRTVIQTHSYMSFCAATILERGTAYLTSYICRQAPMQGRDHTAMEPCEHAIGNT